ncbi:hypothetical protein BASA61_009227 [Batrachochytrium salamandrivorans]|nr:hypothetical protein BASA61_009227 [Batrachochytrium salamandrivorans]KAH9266301.1 hypothetical protein BASA83_010685 [Batrachochytrium salamandrivorans]
MLLDKETHSLLEDCVHYKIYRGAAVQNQSCEGGEQRDWTECDRLEILAAATQLSVDYLWYKEPFRLTLEIDQGIPCLAGSTQFGSSIEDEWFIVYILYTITAQFPNLVVSVSDTDGHFLLIEAADSLPDWLDQSTSDNRVFIFDGSLHIIPARVASQPRISPKEGPTLAQAVELVSTPSIPTVASQEIQDAIRSRIAIFPAAIASQKHRACIRVPLKVAHVLTQGPQLISHAVDAFLTRDPLSMRPCQTMRVFDPSETVLMTATFTKILFAQLKSQRFYPPPKFRLPSQSDPEFQAYELGMKLTCGFEMVYNNPYLQTTSSKELGKQTVETYNFGSDPDWNKFHARLSSTSFFKGQLPGSQLYVALEGLAKQQYLDSKKSNTDYSDGNAYDQIHYILENIVLVSKTSLSQSQPDTDEWMHLDPRKVDEDLANRASQTAPKMENVGKDDSENWSDLGDEDLEELEQLKSIFQGFDSFVNKESGLNGAEFPGQSDDESETYNEDNDSSSEFGHDNKGVQLDSKRFLDTMMSVMGIEDSSSELSTPPSQSEPSLLQKESVKNVDSLLDSATHQSIPLLQRLVDSDDEDDYVEPDYDEELRDYMGLMDQELYSSKLAADFEREELNHEAQSDVLQSRDVFGNVAQGSGQATASPTMSNQNDVDGDTEAEYRPVNLDVNLLKNILESFSSQQGLSGPVSNMMMSMGLNLPYREDGND